MSRAQVAARRCPDCGAQARGRAGLEWLVCPGCPLMFDPFASPPRRLPTMVPSDGDRDARHLVMYRFDVARAGGAARRIAWVCGVRILHVQVHGDPAARLTELGWDPPLERAPLGAAVARGPGAALRILRRRLSLPPSGALAVASVEVVGIPLQEEGECVREPVSGVLLPLAVLLPAPPASGRVL